MQEYPLLDVVAHNVADEGKSDELVIARLWWSSLLAQHVEKKGKGKDDAKEPIQKRVIKKEYNERGPGKQINTPSTAVLEDIKRELGALRNEVQQLRDQFREDKKEERHSMLEIVRIMKGGL